MFKYIFLFLVSFSALAVDLNGSLLTAGSMAASVNSSPLYLGDYNGFSLTATTSATTAVGSLKIQASNDNLPPSSIVNWVDIPGAQATAQAISGTGSFLFNVSDAYYKYVRAVYTRTSGSGILDIRYNIKPSRVIVGQP